MEEHESDTDNNIEPENKIPMPPKELDKKEKRDIKVLTCYMCSTVFERGPTQAEYHIGTRRNKDGTIIHLEDVDLKASHRYVLFNTGNIKPWWTATQIQTDTRGHEDAWQNSGTDYEKRLGKWWRFHLSWGCLRWGLIEQLEDADMWAYNDLMEEVKNLLKLNEIGGVYAKEGKHGGWKLLRTDLDIIQEIEKCNDGEEVKHM
ncbi:hypothetical protein AgCh_018802 [Apium graveolens]